jgi:hypothetical protein
VVGPDLGADAGQWELAGDVPVGHRLVRHVVVAQLGVLHAFGQFGGVLLLDQVQVVDPGPRRLRWCRVVRAGFGVDVPADDVRHRLAHRAAVASAPGCG